MRKPGLSEQEKELQRQYAQQFSSMASTFPDFNITNFLALQDLVEREDASKYIKAGKELAKYFVGGALGGIAVNVAFTRWNPANFLKRPVYVRYPARLVLFSLPMMLTMSFGRPYQMRMEALHQKYNARLGAFRRTRDFNHMDPNGTLFKEFLEKTHK